MHLLKWYSVRHILVLTACLQVEQLRTVKSTDKYWWPLQNIFWLSGNYFSSQSDIIFATKVCGLHKIHWKAASGPWVENPWSTAISKISLYWESWNLILYMTRFKSTEINTCKIQNKWRNTAKAGMGIPS